MRDIPKLWHVTMGKAGESYDKPSNFGLHKRSCCSTWFRRKFDMKFAEELRKILFIREEWAFPDKGILINHHIYIYISIGYPWQTKPQKAVQWLSQQPDKCCS